PKLGGVARRRFIRPAGVVPRPKSTSYRGSAQEPLFLVSPYRAHIRSGHYFIVSPYRAHIRSGHCFIVSPYRAHIRSAHARLRPQGSFATFFLPDASRHSGNLIAPAGGVSPAPLPTCGIVTRQLRA